MRTGEREGANGLAAAVQAAANLLRAEVERMRARGVPVGEDDLRGLYISDQEASRILDVAGTGSEPTPSLPHPAEELVEALGGRMARLAQVCRLSEAECATVALCLVTETDPELERLVAYVQDDVSKKRPRVELVLRLLWEDAVVGQRSFDADARLRALHLVRLHDEAGQAATPLLARPMTLDPRIARFALGGDAIDEVIGPFATLSPANPGNERGANRPRPPLRPASLDCVGPTSRRPGASRAPSQGRWDSMPSSNSTSRRSVK